MRIIILDEDTTGQEVDWSALHELGEVVSYGTTATEAEVVARTQGAEAALTNKVPFPRAVIEQLPDLRFIGVMATGYDRIDLPTARERGITVTNTPGYGTMAVAQHVFALLLSLANRVESHSQDVHAGGWHRKGEWTYQLYPIVELSGRTLGIVGLGDIGQAVARIGQAFGMQVRAYSRTRKEVPGVQWCASPAELFAQSDVVSLHCPLTPETQGLVDAKLLAQLPPHAYLINTARGGLVDEQALRQALLEGRLAGAGLDVISQEPPPADHPLMGLEPCLITPHHAWGSLASRQRLVDIIEDNLRSFLQGEAKNVVG